MPDFVECHGTEAKTRPTRLALAGLRAIEELERDGEGVRVIVLVTIPKPGAGETPDRCKKNAAGIGMAGYGQGEDSDMPLAIADLVKHLEAMLATEGCVLELHAREASGKGGAG